MQHTLAILQMDEEYAYSLMDFMNRQKEFGFKVFAFTNKELYFEFEKKQKVQVLLFDDSLTIEDLSRVRAMSKYYLSDMLNTKEYLGYKAIFMYQSANQIMQHISEFYVLEGNAIYHGKQVEQHHIIGICSATYNQAQCDLGVLVANDYAKQGKTLFLSFQPFLSKATLDQGQGFELSEAIYLIKKGETNPSDKLSHLITSQSSFDYLVGVEHYSDIIEMTADEAIKLLEAITQIGTYQYIILDFPMPGGAISLLLSQCEKIYEPATKDKLSEQLRKEFYRQIALREGEQIIERIQIIDCA
jgi:hypothetical protein